MLFGLSWFLVMQSTTVLAQLNYGREVYYPKDKAREEAWPDQIIRQLAIGDTIPDLRLTNLSN